MRVPDYILPITAYRVWRWGATGLKSMNGEPWLPGQRLSATCRIADGTNVVQSSAAHRRHKLLAYRCTCGIYAAKKVEHLQRFGYDERGITGEVYLWGRVVEHELGWRAEFGYPKRFFLTPDALPFTLASIEARLRSLIVFGAAIFVLSDSVKLPLWDRESGYTAAGFDYLIRRGKEHYARLQSERSLETGDRVAVLGQGFAIVGELNDERIVARLGNGRVVRVPRRDIIFNEQNKRWETELNPLPGSRPYLVEPS